MRSKFFFIILILVQFLPRLVAAQALISSENKPQTGKTVQVLPFFSQYLGFSIPSNFKLASEKKYRTSILLQYIPADESLDNWSQMISVSSMKSAVSREDINLQKILTFMNKSFIKKCPKNRYGFIFSPLIIDGHEALSNAVGCGLIQEVNEIYGETALIFAIKGAEDYYVFQWTERMSELVDIKKTLQDINWSKKIREFEPIFLCPITSDEKLSYENCLNKFEKLKT